MWNQKRIRRTEAGKGRTLLGDGFIGSDTQMKSGKRSGFGDSRKSSLSSRERGQPHSHQLNGNAALQRLRRRRHGRGAAFLEAIIVISTFFVFLYGIMFFHYMFLSKWGALQEARAKAWVVALNGCEAGVGGDSTALMDGAVDKKDTPDDDVEIAGGFSEDGMNSPGWFKPKTAQVQIATHPSGDDVPSGTKTYTVARVFSCNEPFNDKELEMGKGAPGLGAAIGDVIKSILIP